MQVPEIPANESERLAALVRTRLLDSDPEASFDALTDLAATVCETPIALVSLVDRERQWFKSRRGLDASETPRELAFCAHAILAPQETLLVPDSEADPRFCDNPLVTGPPRVRFYAGVPITTQEGLPLGTLCAIDHRPRTLATTQLEALRLIAKQVEALVRERELRFAAAQLLEGWELLESVGDLILTLDGEGRLGFVNRAWCERLGYAREEAAALSLFDLLPPTEHASCRQALARLERAGELRDFPLTLRARSGERVRVLGNARWGAGGRGRVVLRELRGAELLRAEQDRFFALSLDLICICDREGRPLRLNPAWKRVLGWSQGELRGEDLLRRVHPEDLEPTRAAFARVAAGVPLRAFEQRFRHRAGGYRWLHWNAALQPDLDLIYATARDMTEHRLQLECLEESEAHQRAVLEAVLEGVLTVDGEGRILDANPSALRLLETSLPELRALHATQLLRPWVGARRRREAQALDLAQLAGSRREVEVSRPGGTRFPAELSCGEVRVAERRYFTLALRDLTERREVERVKDEFVSTISHELRTPLTSIRGALGLLAGGAMGALPEEAVPVVGIARKNCDRLVRLINEILDFEKLRAGRLELELESCESARLAQEAARALQPLAAERELEVLLELESCPLRADPARLGQVLTNLLSNAIKFSPRGGMIHLRVRQTPLGPIRFEVADQGPGIPSEAQTQLFQRFAQVQSAARRTPGGTGLGLAISKGIVEAHRGRIGVESGPERGSTFWFELPASTTPLPAPPEGPPERSLLLVEDDGDLAALLELELQRAGYGLSRAGSLAEFERALRAQRPRAILLDPGLPDGDGLEFLLREGPELGVAEVPVIVVSAWDKRSDLPPQVLDWQVKPYEGARLLEVLERALAEDS